MTIYIEYEATKQLDFDYDKLISSVVLECLDYEECPYEAEINILLTDDEEIRAVNKEFRGIDRPTDVLSFPALEYTNAGDFSYLEEAVGEFFNPETGELLLGDIVISVDRAISQAEEYGHSLERELGFLAVHGILHLLGYDHQSAEEEAVMRLKEEKVLNKLKLSRER